MSVIQKVAKEAEQDLPFAGEAAATIHAHWDDPEYRNAFTMAFGTFIENMVWAHRHEWQALVNRVVEQQSSKVKRAVVKAYLASAVQEVQKDLYDDRGNRHGSDGRFGSKGSKKVTGLGGLSRSMRGLGFNHEEWAHTGPGTSTMGPISNEEAQARTAARIGDTVNAYSRFSGEESPQGLHFTIEDDKGNERYAVSRDGKLPELEKHERVTAYKPIGIDKPITLGGSTFNLVQALGARPGVAGQAGALTQGIQSAAQAEGGHFGMLYDASQTFQKMSGGDHAPAAAQAAAAFGMYVGKHGPEVSRVLGPHLRRYTYKYRGMIANPQQQALVARNGIQPGETKPEFETKLVHTLASNNHEDGGLGAIPSAAENELLLSTGSTAPSHGFLLDRSGTVKQQAVGVSDDHYVPFNLAELHSLNGGSYVRSRVYGGPTTEDLSLALRTGADHFTTVSRHGSYRVQFENRKGVRARYGDVPVVVVNRYGHLLDAVKSGKVKDPANGGEALKLNGRGYEAALHALKTQFPLLIKSVDYLPPEGTNKEAFNSHEDSGYIRPMYLKPSAAVSGYFDDRLNGEAPRSFDDIEKYRTAKATHLLAQSKYEKTAQATRDAQAAAAREQERIRTQNAGRGSADGTRDGQSPVPAGMSRDATRQAQAGGGTSSQSMDPRAKMSTEDTSTLMNWLRVGLNHSNNTFDPDEVALRAVMGAPGTQAHNDFRDKLASDPAMRQAVIQHIIDRAPDDMTGIDPIVFTPPVFGGKEDIGGRVVNSEAGGAESTSTNYDDLMNSQDGREFKRVTQTLNWRKAEALGQKLNPENQAKFEKNEAWMKAASADDPDSTNEEMWTRYKREGLNELQHYQNALHEAKHIDSGGDPMDYKPIHETIPDETPEPSDSYGDDMMREFRHLDLDGFGSDER